MAGPAPSEDATRPAPCVSVIVPARNAANVIGRQLAALYQQDLSEPFEVIVVDNGSTDATADIARSFMDRLDLRVVVGPTEPNRSLARNVGAGSARADVLAFCDADDEVEPSWLGALHRAVQRHPVVTGANFRTVDVILDASYIEAAAPTFRGVPTLAAGNFAIRRGTYEAVSGFNPAFLHRVDTELTLRLKRAGIDVVAERSAVVRYTRRTSGRAEMRQHYRWAVAGAQLHKEFADVAFSYSWKNSVKHWLLLAPRFLRSLRDADERRACALTLATLSGQLVGSVRYRTFFI